MKPTDNSLERLFKSAARASRSLPDSAPFAVEARVLARWRRLAPEAEELFNLLPLFRRGMALACVVAIAVMAFSQTGERPAMDEVAVIDSVSEIQYLP